ncbi:hypothetical protein ONQ60_26175, partial [Salmonella enterica subsp. enterica serovar Virginia]|nr:hypothetical protein [Salmonella enterica subsp. enterica serovar Virginia]
AIIRAVCSVHFRAGLAAARAQGRVGGRRPKLTPEQWEQAGRLQGKADKFPYVGTTYRLTEHFHYWTKHALLNAIAQPEQFVEIGE